MEAIHAIPTEIEELDPPNTEAAARNGTVQKMFRYSTYLDVGEGAESCEHARDGACLDIEHFHAWCRLPTPHQHQDIRQKGLAAKARRLRLFADPDSDESVVLDQELSTIDDEMFVDQLADELVKAGNVDDFLQAQRDVCERDEFEHIAQDREEYERQRDQAELPEEERTAEYRQLAAHVGSYFEAMNDRMVEIRAPRRNELRSRPVAELVSLVRTKRLEVDGDQTFMAEFDAWLWFVGTYEAEISDSCKRPFKLMWEEIGARDRPAAGTMRAEPPEVHAALHQTYDELRLAMQQGSSGN
jgi:hypothetical protein